MASRNNTSFMKQNYEFLKSLKQDKDSKLLFHQHIAVQYLLKNPDQKGLLVFWGLGRGKTRIARETARLIHTRYKRILVIAPKSVHGQHIEGFKEAELPIDKIHILSIKSNALLKKITKICGDSLDDTFLIIDEAHNLFNSICNGSDQAIELYDLIMASPNCRILFLTGSPMVNRPFEMAPCFNMCAGEVIFPESQEIFNKFFINKNKTFYNSAAFKRRISGLVSYFGDAIALESKDDKFPTKLPAKLVVLPMSEKQYAAYSSAVDIEDEENKQQSQFKSQSQGRFSSDKGSGSYRIRTRKASLIIPIKGKITNAHLKNPDHSIKFHTLPKILSKHPKQKGTIFSDFITNGTKAIGRFLNLVAGWHEFESSINGELVTADYKSYALISGDQSVEERMLIKDAFNSKKNLDGKYLRLLLLGPAAAEGLDLMESRFAINMASFFQPVRPDQFDGRSVRYASHERLIKSKRNVQPYTLLATYPKNLKNHPKEPTTDIFLWNLSNFKRKNAMLLQKALIEASMDCAIHKSRLPKERASRINCFMCNPTNRELYNPDLFIDMKQDDPCKPIEYKKIKTKSVTIKDLNGEDLKFMYESQGKNLFTFYKYSDKLNGYIKIGRSSEYFSALYDKVGGT